MNSKCQYWLAWWLQNGYLVVFSMPDLSRTWFCHSNHLKHLEFCSPCARFWTSLKVLWAAKVRPFNPYNSVILVSLDFHFQLRISIHNLFQSITISQTFFWSHQTTTDLVDDILLFFVSIVWNYWSSENQTNPMAIF